MATQAATIAHMLDTLSALPLTSCRMFGEHALYPDGRTVAFVCDDRLFIRPTPGALALLPGAERGPAHPGSKGYIVGSDLLDDPEDLCCRAMRLVCEETPPPKPKAARRRKGP